MLARLFRKELLLLGSHSTLLLSSAFFSLLLAIVLSFSFQRIGLTIEERSLLVPGAILVSILFLASGIFNQTALLEREEWAMVGILRSGYSGASIYLAKFFSNTLLLFALSILFITCFSVLFEPRLLLNFPSTTLGALLIVTSVSALGTLLSMISVRSERREILFPIIFFPLMIPLVGGGIFILREILLSGTIDFESFPAKLVVALCLLYPALSSLLFEEAL